MGRPKGSINTVKEELKAAPVVEETTADAVAATESITETPAVEVTGSEVEETVVVAESIAVKEITASEEKGVIESIPAEVVETPVVKQEEVEAAENKETVTLSQMVKNVLNVNEDKEIAYLSATGGIFFPSPMIDTAGLKKIKNPFYKG
jgi:hypothetical protein